MDKAVSDIPFHHASQIFFSPFLSSFHGKTHYCVRAAGVKPFTNRLTAWLVSAVVAGYRILICFPFHVRFGVFFWSQSVTSRFCHTLERHPTSSPCRHWDFSRTQASQINSNNFWRKAKHWLLNVKSGVDHGFFLAGSRVPAEQVKRAQWAEKSRSVAFPTMLFWLLWSVTWRYLDADIGILKLRALSGFFFREFIREWSTHCRMMAGSFTCCRLNQNSGVRTAFPTPVRLLMFSVQCFSLTLVQCIQEWLEMIKLCIVNMVVYSEIHRILLVTKMKL